MVYNRYKVDNDVIYSIDYLQIDYHPLGYATHQLFLQLLDSLGELAARQFGKLTLDSGIKHFSGYDMYWWQYGHLHVQTWRIDKGANDGRLTIRLSFNPNKCVGNEALAVLTGYFADNEYMWHYTRVDYTVDVVGKIDDYYVLTRKSEHNYGTTRYYGTRGTSGYLRVYNKRLEVMQRDKEDIGIDLTRFEWEQRGNCDLDFSFDSFSRLNLDGLDASSRLLKYVPPELINAALGEYERHARNRIKRKLFDPIEVDSQVFRGLLAEYEEEYGLIGMRAYTQTQISDIADANFEALLSALHKISVG